MPRGPKLVFAAAGALFTAVLVWHLVSRPAHMRVKNRSRAHEGDELYPIGMPLREAAMVRGDLVKGGEKGSWGHDFGWSLEPGCVRVTMYFLSGRVARVEMTTPYDRDRKDAVIEEKGMSRAEWTAAHVPRGGS